MNGDVSHGGATNMGTPRGGGLPEHPPGTRVKKGDTVTSLLPRPTWQGAIEPEDDMGNRICGKPVPTSTPTTGRQYTPGSKWDKTRPITEPARPPPLDTQRGPKLCFIYLLYTVLSIITEHWNRGCGTPKMFF